MSERDLNGTGVQHIDSIGVKSGITVPGTGRKADLAFSATAYLLHTRVVRCSLSVVKTTERHYAPFVMARRDNLLDAAKAAWNQS